MEDDPPNTSDQPSDPLTRRELEILVLLSGDKSNQEIADQLFLALSTVKGYIQQIYNKLGVGGRREAVHVARELGLLEESTPISPQRHNLPAQLSSFIGREREIEQVTALLDRTALSPDRLGWHRQDPPGAGSHGLVTRFQATISRLGSGWLNWRR